LSSLFGQSKRPLKSLLTVKTEALKNTKMQLNPFSKPQETIETIKEVVISNEEANQEQPALQFKGQTEGFKLIKLDLIDDPNQPLRSNIDQDRLNELVLSIKQMGLIEPIIVRPKGERFEVIAGHRRLLASQIAKTPELPCIVKRLGQEETEIMKLHENMYREDISPLDEAKHFNYLIQSQKISPAKLAQFIGKSATYVSERLATFNYPDELRNALASRKITFSSAREFARHPDPEKIKQFLRYAIQNGVTPNMARQWVQDDMQSLRPKDPNQDQTADGFAVEESQGLRYSCELCSEPIDIQELSVVYMHNKCNGELRRSLADSSDSSAAAPSARA